MLHNITYHSYSYSYSCILNTARRLCLICIYGTYTHEMFKFVQVPSFTKLPKAKAEYATASVAIRKSSRI